MDKITYKDAGVDTKEGERAVKLMKDHVKKTMNANVLAGLGSFGGLFKLDLAGMEEPVLVSGTDGVGTKLKIAFLMDKHDTVGIDCVAMCVNDVLCQGARPLFFLDYIATGKVGAEKIADIVSGIAEGCLQGQSALIGGETAEMPGFYGQGEYDMAGFSVGIVDKKKIVTGDKIQEGDIIIGMNSSGIHSNGYSLVRKVFFDKMGYTVDTVPQGLDEKLGQALLRPTKIYVKPGLAALENHDVHGMVHITGGGFFENIPRVLPEGISAEIWKDRWEVPAIFRCIQTCGDIEEKEMFATFNMGIGMMLFVAEKEAEAVLETIKATGQEVQIIGRTVRGAQEKVVINETKDY